MKRDDDVRALAELAPAPPERDFPAGRARQRELHLLHAITTAQRTRSARRIWLLAGAAVVVVLGLVAATTLFGPTPAAVAATPKPLSYKQDGRPEDAIGLLRQIADATDKLPNPVPATDHLKRIGWFLTRNSYSNAVVPEEIESWLNPDGTGRTVKRSGVPEFPDQAARDRWIADGLSTEAGRPQVTTGPQFRHWPDRPPTDPAELARWLQKDHPPANGAGEVLVAITDLLRERALTPAERAAVLRVLATVPGLVYQGSTTDRLGRTGRAFALTNSLRGLPTRHTLIVSQDNGIILGEEQMLTESSGKLGLPVPSVVGYTVFELADHAAVP
ncbi:CU044_5270 family protein [Crossiella cryophila]|uniref:CU044_5270 family protein n=1 Tax=Crossiella cryophila TaxID=43355 RepID=A0A7W7FXB9_9PSEU|nr:CU044_5270 family protein [Crossiella cryophila]MBB4678744.1 hypothetical protein [Crossiella cryophila]